MSDYELNKKLKELKIEDYIWLLYIGIIFISWYSNYLERKYYIYNDIESKNKYRKINILVFTILLIVYLYFFNNTYDSFKSLKRTDSNKKKSLVTLSFIASLLLVISGFIFLYIALDDQELDVELAFN